MKTRHIFSILSVIMLVLVTLAVAMPVHANKPDQYFQPLDDTYIDNTICQDIPIEIHVWGQFHFQYFYDQDGNITKMHISAPDMKQTWSANGKSLTARVSGPEHDIDVTATSFYRIFVGPGVKISIPHYGFIYGWTGKVVIFIDTSDPQNWVYTFISFSGPDDKTNMVALCDYFAP